MGMQGFLDRDALSGTYPAQRHLRPVRHARLVFDSDFDDFVQVVERLCQTWGGASDLLVPVSREGAVEESYVDLLRRSELDRLVVPTRACDSDAARQSIEDLAKLVRLESGQRREEIPVLLIAAARDRERFKPLTSVTVVQESPWHLAYLVELGRLPENPSADLLDRAGAREGLRFEEVIDVRREVVAEPGLADLRERRSVPQPVGLSRLALTSRRLGNTQFALDGWLEEPQAWARQLGGDLVVMYQPDSVADACLLWNLRAVAGWPVGHPVGLPCPRRADGTIDVVQAVTLVRDSVQKNQRWGLHGPLPVLTSASLSPDELAEISSAYTSANGFQPEVAAPGDILTPGRPASRSAATALTFETGRALIATRTDEDREWLAALSRGRAALRMTVCLERQPIPTIAALRSREDHWLRYGGGGSIVRASDDDIREVIWPQTWTMLEAVANEHGLRVAESPNGQQAMSLTRLAGGPSELQWLCHRGLLRLLYDTAASTSMSWFKKRATKLAEQVAQVQDDPAAAMVHFSQILEGVNVSHDAETSGTFSFGQLKTALATKDSGARAWLSWAERQQLVERLVQLRCEHCGCKLLNELAQAAPPIPCPRCGLTIRAPFDLSAVTFRYRLSEPLRRSIGDDSVYHALIMRWLISALNTRPDYLVGAHTGVNFYRDEEMIGEADVVLLFADGSLVPAEVKRHGRQLNDTEVGKLRAIASAVDAPAIILGAGDSHVDCPQALNFDVDDGSCRVITSDYWLNPQPRPAFGWADLPHWGTGHDVPAPDDYEATFGQRIAAAQQRAFGSDDPVRRLWRR
ncbi:hypothetical protein ACIHFB_06730 [Streptomyces sp. NPDC051963]|uniref:hypothetical protein n=1 Tax=Streptomyces sp. NPDC051963 TaxID=3365678 RepID=UPI0037D810A5